MFYDAASLLCPSNLFVELLIELHFKKCFKVEKKLCKGAKRSEERKKKNSFWHSEKIREAKESNLCVPNADKKRRKIFILLTTRFPPLVKRRILKHISPEVDWQKEGYRNSCHVEFLSFSEHDSLNCVCRHSTLAVKGNLFFLPLRFYS